MKNLKITVIRTAVDSPTSVGFIKALKEKEVRIVAIDCNSLSRLKILITY